VRFERARLQAAPLSVKKCTFTRCAYNLRPPDRTVRVPVSFLLSLIEDQPS
jgi:hypothetical protein